MGTNAMRRSGALNFLGALGVKTPPGIATGKRTKEELAAAAAADAAAKTSVLGRMGTMVTAIKGQSAKITRLVDALPVPDSVKSFVHDPKSVLPKSARDLLDTAQNSFNQPGESADNADLENAEPPKESVILAATTGVSTPKSILKKESRVTIAPSPTFSDDVVLDGGIQLTNTRARTPTQLRTPVRNTTNNTYDTHDNLDNLDENVLIPDAATLSSNFVRNPGSLGTQAGPTIVKPKIPTPTLPEGCKCEACLAAKAAHAPPPPPPSTADVMKQLEDLKKFMVEQMKPQQPVTVPVPEAAVVAAPVPIPVPVPVPVPASEPAERLPKIVYPGNGRSHTSPITGKIEPVTEAPVTEAPVTEAPVTEAPVTETVVTEAPVAEALVTEATETKVSETPITEATKTRAPITETQDPPKATIEVNAHELEEIRALLAERQKDHQVRS